MFRDMATSIVEEYKWIVMDGTADPAWIGRQIDIRSVMDGTADPAWIGKLQLDKQVLR